MSKIHYVWWGNPATDELRKNATETPNKMVAAVHGKHEVHYWIGGGAGFSAPLDPRIIQHKIDPVMLLKGTSLVSLGPTRLKAVLDKLSEFRAFAACKDLVSFAVMLREGGYFFDTTTVIGEGYHQLKQEENGKWVPRDPSRPTNIARLLAGHPDVRAPYNPVGVKNLYPNDESVDFVMSFGVGTIAKAGSVVVPNFDVWALYSPRAGHDAFKRAVETYIKRAENIGISSPDKKPLGKKTVTEIMSDPDKNSRNLIIAGLSTTSLLDAFYNYGKAHGHTMTDLGWAFAKINKDIMGTPAQPVTPANPNGVPEVRSPKLKLNPLGVLLGKKKMNTVKIYGGLEAAALTLPMIGIQKRFAGSWR